MVEKALIHHICPKCKKFSYPRGHKEVTLPFMDPIVCPYCGFQVEGYVLDSELTKEKLKKDLSLDVKQTDNSQLEILNRRLDASEANQKADRAEIALLKQRVEILENQKMQEILSSLSDRIGEINGLTEQVRDIKDKIKFQEENK